MAGRLASTGGFHPYEKLRISSGQICGWLGHSAFWMRFQIASEKKTLVGHVYAFPSCRMLSHALYVVCLDSIT